jgi:hypothetical protein
VEPWTCRLMPSTDTSPRTTLGIVALQNSPIAMVGK